MTTSTLFDLFTQHNAAWLIAVSVFSLLVGSFLNVLILRLPKAMQAEWEQECQALLQPSKQEHEPLAPTLAAI
ncbi:MAG: prepilin peptidase, partial [Oceanospirillaceae bacterium]|nr:prepilin peptidase [Oceanospirillaceae bacterium]